MGCLVLEQIKKFRRSKAEGSVLHDKLGIAPTPGSEYVLDRETGRLEKCTKIRCPYSIYYEDIGWVNSAPYAANGGWGAAVNAHTTPEKQKALADFFLWASSREQSEQYVIPNATLPWYMINGQDPWRKSQLDVEKWVARGFDRELSKQYLVSILNNLVSKNVVVEARFPKAGEIMSVLDKEVNEYLVAAHEGTIAESDRDQERRKTADTITRQWNQIIRSYNTRGDTVAPILEIYQRLRGVWIPNEERNHLTGIRIMGYTMVGLIALFSTVSATWVYRSRESVVVKASQPPFLALICFGTLVMGSSIIAMGIDDSMAGQRGCNMACMATPWLIGVGFSITFAALASKILRLKTLMYRAVQFRRIEVLAHDVLIPFCIILALNTGFLLTWTLEDPLRWERVDSGRTEAGILSSYGRCASSGNLSTVMIALIAGVNAIAIVAANVLAYQTRNMCVAFNESKFVGLSMGSILQAVLIGTPLLFLADSNPTARYVVRSLLVFVICMSILVFIFLPKMMEGEKTREDVQRSIAKSLRGGHSIARSSVVDELKLAAESAIAETQHEALNDGTAGIAAELLQLSNHSINNRISVSNHMDASGPLLLHESDTSQPQLSLEGSGAEKVKPATVTFDTTVATTMATAVSEDSRPPSVPKGLGEYAQEGPISPGSKAPEKAVDDRISSIEANVKNMQSEVAASLTSITSALNAINARIDASARIDQTGTVSPIAMRHKLPTIPQETTPFSPLGSDSLGVVAAEPRSHPSQPDSAPETVGRM